MSFGTDFFGAFATNIGGQMQQNEDDQRKLALDRALEKHRRKLAKEDADEARQHAKEDEADRLNAMAQPTPLMGRYVMPEFRVEDGHMRRKDTDMGDAPPTRLGRVNSTTKDGKRSGTEYTDGLTTWTVWDGEPMPPRAPAGSTRQPRAPVIKDFGDGRGPQQYNFDTGGWEAVPGVGPKAPKRRTEAASRAAAGEYRALDAEVTKAETLGDIDAVITRYVPDASTADAWRKRVKSVGDDVGRQAEVLRGLAKDAILTDPADRETADSPAGYPTPPPAAISDLISLKNDPTAIKEFNATFGPGAAERVLKGKR